MIIRSVEHLESFQPEFNGNMELPEAERITVHVKEQISNLQLSKYKKFTATGNGTSIEYDDAKIARFHIGKIENLEESDGTKITNGVELADSKNKNLYDLMTEIRDKLLNESDKIPQGEK